MKSSSPIKNAAETVLDLLAENPVTLSIRSKMEELREALTLAEEQDLAARTAENQRRRPIIEGVDRLAELRIILDKTQRRIQHEQAKVAEWREGLLRHLNDTQHNLINTSAVLEGQLMYFVHKESLAINVQHLAETETLIAAKIESMKSYAKAEKLEDLLPQDFA